jgi:hypothetical protein
MQIGLIVALGALWRLSLAFFIIPSWETGRNIPPFPDHYPELAQSLLDDGTLGYGLICGGGQPDNCAWAWIPTLACPGHHHRR